MLSALKKYNTHLIVLSVSLSVLLASFFPEIFSSLRFIGEVFINLLKVFSLPLISTALIVALGAMNSNLQGLQRLARSTLSYMLVSEIIAVSIALLLFNTFKPGLGINPQIILQGGDYLASKTAELSLANFIVGIFPHNIFDSLVKFDLLPVVSFSVMFGIGCSLVGEAAKPVIALATSIRDVANSCLLGVMLVAPLGIFSLVGGGVAQARLNGNLFATFLALLSFVLVLLLALFLHGLWQLLAVALLSKQSLGAILRQSTPVFATAFATSSSLATLPMAMETASRLGARPLVTRFMLPVCASINIGGMMIYEVAAVLFFSQMLGFDLSLYQQLLLALASILTGMAAGGIPETSMISMVVVFKMANIPLSAISILLPLDRILDRLRTMVNIFGNMCAVLVVSRIIARDQDLGEGS